jgi:uncharacterized membrane protein (DUF485 family)
MSPHAFELPRRGHVLRLSLFALYLALYVGFMLLTAFNLPLMAWAPFGGVNLAILYGFGLIVAALALALLYWWLSRGDREPEAGPRTRAGAGR